MTKQYDAWVKWIRNKKELKPLTGNQYKFVEFLLKNHEVTKRVGHFIHLFIDTRDFIRENPELFKDEENN